MESTTLSLNQRQYIEAAIAALPHLAETVAAIPADCQVKAFEAAERSFLRTFRQLGLSGPETWASSIMRRLRRRVGEACLTEKDRLQKLYEQLSASGGLETVSRQAHSFEIPGTASSGQQKDAGREDELDKLELFRQLSGHEEIGLARSFGTHDETSSRERKSIRKEGKLDNQKAHQQFSADDAVERKQKNVGRDGRFSVVKLHEQLPLDEQIGQARSFHTHGATSSAEQKEVGSELDAQLSTDQQAAQAQSFEIHDTASSGKQDNVGREREFDKLKSEQFSADEQIAHGHSFEIPNAASLREQEDVGREGEFDKLMLHEQVSADEQIGQADGFGLNDAVPSVEQKSVGKERAKTAVAPRMAKPLINIDEIFDSGRRVEVENPSMREARTAKTRFRTQYGNGPRLAYNFFSAFAIKSRDFF